MALMIRQIDAHDSVGRHLALEARASVIPPATVVGVLAECRAAGRRTRELPGLVTLFFCIAMNLYAGDCLGHVFRQLVLGLRWLWPEPAALRVSKGALCQARYRLGARPLARLFRQVCRPLATPTTPGAFLFGLRLMALDGTAPDIPDTPANVRAFGRQRSPRGTCAWPRVQVVALSECGTHAICDAGLWRWDADERAAGRRLLRSVGRGVLLLWDRGFHSCATITATRATGAHFLGRLPATDTPCRSRRWPTVANWSGYAPAINARRRRGEAVVVRLIRYTLDDPGRPGHAAEHRLVTSPLNPRGAPARELVLAYHARWEFELAADEVKTHQRPAAGALCRPGGDGRRRPRCRIAPDPPELHRHPAPDPRGAAGFPTGRPQRAPAPLPAPPRRHRRRAAPRPHHSQQPARRQAEDEQLPRQDRATSRLAPARQTLPGRRGAPYLNGIASSGVSALKSQVKRDSLLSSGNFLVASGPIAWTRRSPGWTRRRAGRATPRHRARHATGGTEIRP